MIMVSILRPVELKEQFSVSQICSFIDSPNYTLGHSYHEDA